jgi:hypothetical protein
MTRRYHRQWHQQHGKNAARMRLEEVTDERGQLRASPPSTARLLGSPGYIYADAAKTAWRWLFATAGRRPARATHHEHRMRYLAAYLRRTASLSRGTRSPFPADLVDFVHDHVRRRARVVNMTAGRFVAVNALVAVLLAASAYDIATGREHWPFSPYPMFSSVERSWTLDSLLLTGVAADSSGREFPFTWNGDRLRVTRPDKVERDVKRPCVDTVTGEEEPIAVSAFRTTNHYSLKPFTGSASRLTAPATTRVTYEVFGTCKVSPQDDVLGTYEWVMTRKD